MKRDDLRGWLLATNLSMPARFVFVALTLHTDRENTAWPSIGRLAIETGSSDRTVQRALRELEAFGDVVSVERPGASTLYRLNPRHSDRGDTESGVTQTTERGDKSAPDPRHSDTQKELKELVRSAPPPPDTSIAPDDRTRGVAAVNAIRTAKAAALHTSRSDAQ